MGCRTGDVACRAGGAGVSVPPAHDGKRQAGADQNDGRARLDGGRAWLAGQGDDTATGGLEPATSCGPAAPQARSAAGAPRSHPAGAAVAQLCRGWARFRLWSDGWSGDPEASRRKAIALAEQALAVADDDA